ncbi:hypothetical protein BDV06DRAFT_227847 [Aspergillus oleicola]
MSSKALTFSDTALAPSTIQTRTGVTIPINLYGVDAKTAPQRLAAQKLNLSANQWVLFIYIEKPKDIMEAKNWNSRDVVRSIVDKLNQIFDADREYIATHTIGQKKEDPPRLHLRPESKDTCLLKKQVYMRRRTRFWMSVLPERLGETIACAESALQLRRVGAELQHWTIVEDEYQAYNGLLRFTTDFGIGRLIRGSYTAYCEKLRFSQREYDICYKLNRIL